MQRNIINEPYGYKSEVDLYMNHAITAVLAAFPSMWLARMVALGVDPLSDVVAGLFASGAIYGLMNYRQGNFGAQPLSRLCEQERQRQERRQQPMAEMYGHFSLFSSRESVNRSHDNIMLTSGVVVAITTIAGLGVLSSASDPSLKAMSLALKVLLFACARNLALAKETGFGAQEVRVSLDGRASSMRR